MPLSAVPARDAASGPVLCSLGVHQPRPGRLVPQADHAEAAIACLHDATSAEKRLIRGLHRRTTVRQRLAAVLPPGVEPGGHVAALRALHPPPEEAGDRGPGTAERMRRWSAAALPMAVDAARRALDAAQRTADDVAQLVTVGCTGFAAPGLDLELMRQLDLPPGTGRTHVGFMGCHGALNGLRVAGALSGALRHGAPDRRHVLLVCTEVCTAHFAYGRNREQWVANALFGDGAAAAVLGPAAPGQEGGSGLRLVDQTSRVLLDTGHHMGWHVGDHGFEMALSPRVPDVLQDALPPLVTPWLASHGLVPADVPQWAVHPGGPRLLDAVGTALHLPPSALAASRAVLRERGNMSSPTVLCVLDRLRQDAGGRLAGPCVLAAFGPGLTAELALLWG